MNNSAYAQELPIGTLLGEYEIIKILGAGGFGVTYLAQEEGLDRLVVIKENLPAMCAVRNNASLLVTARTKNDNGDFEWAINNFLNEAKTLALLDHPGIVKILRAFSANGTAYFVMPYVKGNDLEKLAAQLQEQGKSFSRKEIEKILHQLLNALEYLHERNILHRDIKPANILMASATTPVFIDFGAARQQLGEKSMTVIESAGYTPFEQMQSKGNVGPWSDLYSLGATLYKVITGEAPPKNANRMGKTDPYQPLSRQKDWIRILGYSLLSSIDKALSLWPEDRFFSAKEWKSYLESNDSTRDICAYVSDDKKETPQATISSPASSYTQNPQNNNTCQNQQSHTHAQIKDQYYLTLPNGQQEGPYTNNQVRSRQAVGKVPLGSFFWQEGMASWVPIEEQFPTHWNTFENKPNSISHSQSVLYYIKKFLKKWRIMKGRSSRKEFWAGTTLFYISSYILWFFIDLFMEMADHGYGILYIPALIFFIVFILMAGASLNLMVRRFHDVNMSAWFIIIHIVTYGLLGIVCGCIPGNPFKNKYGDPPL